MKYFIIIISFLISTISYSQYSSADSLITGWQLQAGTWRTIAEDFKLNSQFRDIPAFAKIFGNFKSNVHSDNANVTLDSISTVMVVFLYERVLFDIEYGDILDDFQSSLTSKRNTNDMLDDKCDELDARLTERRNGRKEKGRKIFR